MILGWLGSWNVEMMDGVWNSDHAHYRFVQQPRSDIDRQHSSQEKALEDEITSLGKKVRLTSHISPYQPTPSQHKDWQSTDDRANT